MHLNRNISVNIRTKKEPKYSNIEVYYDPNETACWVIKIPSQGWESKPTSAQDGIMGSKDYWENKLKEAGVKYAGKYAKAIEEYAIETRNHPPNGWHS